MDIPLKTSEKENINKLQAIETFGKHFNDLVERNKRSWETENTTKKPELISAAIRVQEEIGNKLESMCFLLGIEIDWPGLYPSFKMNGYSCHTIEDALAMKEGFNSFGIMKQEYEQQ